ncbi:C2H2 finger domain-containing protein [Chaetomium strumarium]|uniref:C2H2 finger domain-containing protein n=1 Tax=Chaetomium strumarium TaxID=1170767 RepID=A0AAJ0M0V1_9PEZI|nr:C2H2 finger domain-containing protein [Chaetomium strumarium]
MAATLHCSDDEFSLVDRSGDEVADYNSDYSLDHKDLFDAEQADTAGYKTDLTDEDDGNIEDKATLLVEEQWNKYYAYIKRNLRECFESVSGTKKASSLRTYWKVFWLVYERAIIEKLDIKLNRQMHRALRSIAKKHSLSNEKREKRCMTIEDLKKQIDTIVSTIDKTFHVGECRVLYAFFYELLAPSGSRPEALLLLQFRHDPCLLLSPYVFLLGVLFANQAFEAPSLISLEKLYRLDIHLGDLSKTFIFRKIKRVGKLTGFKISTILYNLRYNAASEFDKSADDPCIRELVWRRDVLYARSRQSAEVRRKYEKAATRVTKEKLRLRRALKSQIREEFDTWQAIEDIERQLAGHRFQDMKHLVKVLYAPIDYKTVEELYKRRDTIINAVATYCKVKEGWRLQLLSEKKASANIALVKTYTKDPLEGSLLQEALLSMFKKKIYRCFLCVRKAYSIRVDDLRFPPLIHEFYSPRDITKYFRCKHLSNLQKDKAIIYTACNLKLIYKEYLKCYAINIYRTVP